MKLRIKHSTEQHKRRSVSRRKQTSNQAPKQSHKPISSDWTQLPAELLILVCTNLEVLKDVLTVELSCKSWLHILKEVYLWGDLQIELDTLRCSDSSGSSEAKGSYRHYLPTCRWLRARARGIASLLLTTTSEVSTTDDDSDDDSDQRISSTDLEHHREVFAALVASLAGTQVDLSVDFDDRPGLWELKNQPMLAQALTSNLVSLSLPGIDVAEWQQLGALTSLTYLNMMTPDDLDGHGSPMQAITTLTRLSSLHLTAIDETLDSTIMHVDLGTLSQLTELDLNGVAGSFGLAGTAACLRTLDIQDAYATDLLPPGGWSALTCLTRLNLRQGRLCDSELLCLQQVRSLEELCLNFEDDFDDPESGEVDMAMFCRALGCLTSLRRLEVHYLRCSSLDFAQLGSLSRLRCFELCHVQAENFQVPCGWASLETLVLDDTALTQPPGNLSALKSLTRLTMTNCTSHFQIRAPLDFLTQIKSLRSVQLHHSSGTSKRPWNADSMFALMHVQMLLDGSPECNVELSDS